MLHFLSRILSRLNNSTHSNEVVLHAHVVEPPSSKRGAPKAHALTPSPAPIRVTHRQRLLSMELEHIKLCSPRRCERLRSLGVKTAGDLSSANPRQLASNFGAQRKAYRVLSDYRRAVRLAASVPGMMPRDALLLISIHRRSVQGLASESAPALHRDLERFAESTRGRVQLRGRRVPSTRRLKQWIAACQQNASQRPLQASHAV